MIKIETIPTVDLKLETIKVEPKVRLFHLTIGNTHWRGYFSTFQTKFMCLYNWLFYNRDKTFKEYLDTPVHCVVGGPDNLYLSVQDCDTVEVINDAELLKELNDGKR